MIKSTGSGACVEDGKGKSPSLVSVVIPAYNESQNVAHLISEVANVLDGNCSGWEIIVVDDGSTDGTYDDVRGICHSNPRVKALRLSRNFGKEAALIAGLKMAKGRAVITMDADLQHPPSTIPDLLKSWRRGAKVVHAVKRSRKKDRFIVRWRAAMFNALMMRFTGINTINSSDFKLLDRIVVDTIINQLPESRRFYRGLVGWIGFDAATVPFDVAVRYRGDAKMSFRRLLSLAMLAIVAFTAAPLRIVTVLGALSLCFAAAVATDAIVSWSQGKSVSGFATLIITILFSSSAIMISLGILGEYIANLYDEVKGRPKYLVESTTGFADSATAPVDPQSLPEAAEA